MLNKTDKNIEKERFDKRALEKINEFDNKFKKGSSEISESLRTPYLVFESLIDCYIKKNMEVLEVGSGNGQYTHSLLKNNARVIASDISENCLELIKKRYSNYFQKGFLKTKVADMESLPYENNRFDAVVIAGSLSYGDGNIVDKEISRVLKPRGIFLCVDSLNENYIYRTNRYLQYLMQKRSRLTIENMPDFNRINAIKKLYNKTTIQYFGKFSWLFIMLESIIGGEKSKKLSDYIDNRISINSLAFKFVLSAIK